MSGVDASRDEAQKPYAVRALLTREQEILLIHHTFENPAMFDKWTFPGGRLDPHETDPIEALHRELAEELSVEVEVLGALGVFYSRTGLDYHIFAARPLSPIGPLQVAEIRDTVWLTPAEIYEWHTKDKLQFGFEMEAISVYLRHFT